MAHAGSFNINPVRIHLSEKVTTEVLHVTNSGKNNVTVQLQPMQWLQHDGEDQLTATRDLIATPQIFNLKAGTSQIVRLGLVKKQDLTKELTKELTYRLILDEIPPPPEPGFQGLRLALRVSLPVFVRASTTPPSEASAKDFDIRPAQEKTTVPGMINLELSNTGRTHVQLLNLKIYSADAKEELMASLEKGIYLLAGQKKNLQIKTKIDFPQSSPLLIRAETSTGKVEFNAKPGAP